MTGTKTRYSEKLRDPRWQKKRLKILDRDGWRCTNCQDDETELHVHHERYSGQPWEVADQHLITLCADCHAVVSGKTTHLFQVAKYLGAQEFAVRACLVRKELCELISHRVSDLWPKLAPGLIRESVMRESNFHQIDQLSAQAERLGIQNAVLSHIDRDLGRAEIEAVAFSILNSLIKLKAGSDYARKVGGNGG